MLSKLKVAVIGLGDVAGRRHLPILANHPRFEISAAAEVNPERAQTAARAFSIPRVSADPLAVIRSPDTDIVAIFTPPFTHADLARAALEAGKHVFVEKPMTIGLREAEELTEQAERAGTTLLVGFNLRHHLSIRDARKMIREGRLGTIRTAATLLGNTRARNTGDAWRREPTRGGDVFFEFGVHHFDILRFLLDSNVTELYASETCSPGGGMIATTQLRFANGIFANATVAEDTVEHNSIEIVGDRGKLNLNLYRFDGLQFIPRGALEGSLGMRLSDVRNVAAALPSAVPRIRKGGEYLLTYRAEWDHLSAILQDHSAPLAGARDGLEATRIAHAARQSVAQHAPVPL